MRSMILSSPASQLQQLLDSSRPALCSTGQLDVTFTHAEVLQPVEANRYAERSQLHGREKHIICKLLNFSTFLNKKNKKKCQWTSFDVVWFEG